MQVVFSAASVVTNLLPTIIDVVVGLSVAPIVEVVLIIDEAAVIAWVVNDWFEAIRISSIGNPPAAQAKNYEPGMPYVYRTYTCLNQTKGKSDKVS